MDNRLESKVDEHDRMLVEMQTILKGMAESQTKMADNMGNMAQAIGKIDLWLEKITNLDGNTKDSFKRSYKVIQDLEDKVDEGFKDLEVTLLFNPGSLSNNSSIFSSIFVSVKSSNIE